MEEKGRANQHTENVVTKLRELQTQAPELVLCLGAQGVAALGPECDDGRADV